MFLVTDYHLLFLTVLSKTENYLVGRSGHWETTPMNLVVHRQRRSELLEFMLRKKQLIMMMILRFIGIDQLNDNYLHNLYIYLPSEPLKYTPSGFLKSTPAAIYEDSQVPLPSEFVTSL